MSNIQQYTRARSKELPMFEIEKVQPRILLDLADCAVSNDILVFVQKNGLVHVIDLQKPSAVEEILPDAFIKTKRSSKIQLSPGRCCFLDESGYSWLISLGKGLCFYICRSSLKPKPLKFLKDIKIQTCHWLGDKYTGGSNGRTAIIGDSVGHLFEIIFDSAGEPVRKDEQSLKPVWTAEDEVPITGIYCRFHYGEGGFAFISTPSRLYYFEIGGRNLYTLKKLFGSTAKSSTLVDHSVSGFSSLAVKKVWNYSSTNRRITVAWLSSAGIWHGEFAGHLDGDNEVNFGDHFKLYSLDKSNVRSIQGPYFTMSRLNFFILHDGKLRIVSILDHSLLFEKDVSTHLTDIFHDNEKGTFWFRDFHNLYELIINEEDRNLPYQLLDAGRLDDALTSAKDDAQKDIVRIAIAKDYFRRGKYNKAAEYFSDTSTPISEVGLDFMELKQFGPLRLYLVHKLRQCKSSDKMQKVMLSVWILELFISDLADVEYAPERTSDSDGVNRKADSSEATSLKKELNDFIIEFAVILDRATAYQLFERHGRIEYLLNLANCLEDYDTIFMHWLSQENWEKIISTIRRGISESLLIDNASFIMKNSPVEFCDLLLLFPDILVAKIVPALVDYHYGKTPELKQNQALRCLKFFVFENKTKQTPIINTYLSLLLTYKEEAEEEVIKFLESQPLENSFDYNFAMTACLDHGLVKAAVIIYMGMKQYEDAVEVALSNHEFELAKSIAETSDLTEEKKKQLWFRIAKKSIDHYESAENILNLLKGAEYVKIDDLLPVLPDSVGIENVKDEICHALESYASEIDSLQNDMNVAVTTTEKMKENIQRIEKQFAIIQPGEPCHYCLKPLLPKAFFVFPCQHAFHASCLLNQTLKAANAWTRRRIKELLKDIKNRKGKQEEILDSLISEECILCGQHMVNSIDLPFVEEHERDEALSWNIPFRNRV